jgi:transcriptional regulator with XRE-family HTH domain
MFKTILPRRIIRMRELHRLTQHRLAELADIAVQTLNEIESGTAADMKVSTLVRICSPLSTTPDLLLGFDEPRRMSTGSCPVCKVEFASTHLHTVGECICLMWDSGRNAAQISSIFGLMQSSVEHIVREEYSVRRVRRNPSAIGVLNG